MKVPSLYRRLGTTIRKYRHHLGFTQEQLAHQLGISRASLANMETGRQRMLVHQLYHFAKELDVKIEELLPCADENKEYMFLDDLLFSENLTLEQRQQIARLLQDDD